MQRNGVKTMGLALGVGFLAQVPQGALGGLPIWVFLLLALLVIVAGIIWVLHEEGEEKQKAGEAGVAAEAAAAPTELPPATLAAEAPPLEADDLKRIEGIGPKISGLLQAAGIRTFAQLAAAEVERLQQILTEAGITQISDPSTWPEQAGLAASGDWDALEALQGRLKGGRRA